MCARCTYEIGSDASGYYGPRISKAEAVSISIVMTPVLNLAIAGGWFNVFVRIDAVGQIKMQANAQACTSSSRRSDLLAPTAYMLPESEKFAEQTNAVALSSNHIRQATATYSAELWVDYTLDIWAGVDLKIFGVSLLKIDSDVYNIKASASSKILGPLCIKAEDITADKIVLSVSQPVKSNVATVLDLQTLVSVISNQYLVSTVFKKNYCDVLL
jgi:hypothetical protein